MNDLILIKSGSLNGRNAMPNLNYSSTESNAGSELGYRTDTKELYVGTKDGNVRLCGAGDLAEAKAYTDNKIAGVNGLISTINTEINNIKATTGGIDAKITEIEGTLAEIIARLDALVIPETPSE